MATTVAARKVQRRPQKGSKGKLSARFEGSRELGRVGKRLGDQHSLLITIFHEMPHLTEPSSPSKAARSGSAKLQHLKKRLVERDAAPHHN